MIRMSSKRLAALLIAFLVLGGLVGYAVNAVDINKVEAEQENPLPNVRTQAKFLPLPPIKMLKTETVLWIDPGWDVVGVTGSHLVLKMSER